MESSSPQDPVPPSGGTLRVLLVEDNDDHAELLVEALERSTAARFSVQRDATSKDALESAAPGAFSALLLDYQLGDIDGVELLERIRAGGTDTPAIVLTSHGSEMLAARALRAQADDYLAKTEALADEALARAVLRVVERRRLAQQLTRVREEAAAARARDAFLAASHDLKNPLTVIRGTAQILQRRATRQGSVPQEQLVAGLNSIERAAAQMATQIDELLDVAHLRVGRALELNRAPADVVELAREQVAALQQSAELHRIELQTAERKLVAEIDRARVARVLANLLNNAVKYSPQGGRSPSRVVAGGRQGGAAGGADRHRSGGRNCGRGPSLHLRAVPARGDGGRAHLGHRDRAGHGAPGGGAARRVGGGAEPAWSGEHLQRAPPLAGPRLRAQPREGRTFGARPCQGRA